MTKGVGLIRSGTGAATYRVERVSLGDGSTCIRKAVRPLLDGPHAAGSADPRHWAYWRREHFAYGSTLLPASGRLRAPRCLQLLENAIVLEDVDGLTPTTRQAAAALGSWQIPFNDQTDEPWLATDQIGKRLSARQPDWSTIDADGRVLELWSRRAEYYERLQQLPRVLSHGDFSVGNLIESSGQIVAIDWATMGWEPVGFDLAHLALSTGEVPLDGYELTQSTLADAARVGFQTTVAIVGASRVHWMLSADIPLPDWYIDFLWANRPES